MILVMFGQKEWRSCDPWSCDNLWPVHCIQANKISHGGLWRYDKFLKVPAGTAKGAKIRVQGSGKRVMARSYGQGSFIMCSHWKRMCRVHFIMCSHWIHALAVILDICLMPLAVCALWLFLILTFGVSCSDKPLWLDKYLWLDDSLCFTFKLSFDDRLLGYIYTGTSLQYFPSLVVLRFDV